MQTVRLSESAVAVLRFRVKGYRLPVTEQRLAAYRELAEAGIMEPDGNDFRFTDEGWTRRKELLRDAEVRIERDRFEPPDVSGLSEAARGLLRRISAEEPVEVTDQNRPEFRELAAARIVMLMHTFAHGDESGYQFTYWGWRKRFELLRAPARGTVRT
jgi:hypothetical protein